MEIDFLGLSLPKYDMEQHSSQDVSTDTANEGGVETSLSLSTSSLDCQREIPSFCEKNKTWEFPRDKMIPSCSGTMCSLAHCDNENAHKIEQPSPILAARLVFHPPPTTTGFQFDLNKSRDLSRNMSELQAEPTTLTNMLYPVSTNVYKYASPQKPDNAMYITGDASNHARTCTTGHTPTVAMARKATLARFLEKRVHRLRMNQARTPHLIRKSMNASEAHDTVITRSNKNKNNSLIR